MVRVDMKKGGTHMRNMQRIALWGWVVILSISMPPLVIAQNRSTFTTTATSNALSNNPELGCPDCSAILNATDPFPDTSAPIFQGDPIQSLLPSIIALGLPADNQFGVGVAAGSSGLPISRSAPFSVGTFLNISDDFDATPVAGGGMDHDLTFSINQVTPGGTTTGADQPFAILFSVQSMTDPDGKLVGAATGTFTQTLDGVITNGTFQFDETNGLSGTNLHP
ncbi:hypothetical protein JYT92_00560 [bacterium AH-315-L15]|nr:hypothetical protein [bacterium AH-315-L15]